MRVFDKAGANFTKNAKKPDGYFRLNGLFRFKPE